MFKKILVPVDGSETAWRALNNALEIGKKFESEILVVNVIQPYNNAALLAVPLDHATINQGNSELEKVGDKVLELAKEMVGSYPHKVEYGSRASVGTDHRFVQKSGSRRDRFGQPRTQRHC